MSVVVARCHRDLVTLDSPPPRNVTSSNGQSASPIVSPPPRSVSRGRSSTPVCRLNWPVWPACPQGRGGDDDKECLSSELSDERELLLSVFSISPRSRQQQQAGRLSGLARQKRGTRASQSGSSCSKLARQDDGQADDADDSSIPLLGRSLGRSVGRVSLTVAFA